MTLPTFLIIGAMKSGTSSLHEYLGKHPDVFTTRRKELNFFTRAYSQGVPWYEAHFRKARKCRARGESSPNYMKLHYWRKVPQRIHQLLPDVRLVCILRNPVERALSHYLHNIHRGRLENTLTDNVSPDNNIVMTSRYSWQLSHYLEYFDADQILLTSTDELASRPDDLLAKIFGFLGVDDNVTVDVSRRANVTAAKLASAPRVVPDDPAVTINDGHALITAAMRTRLAEMLAPDVEKLRSWWPDAPVWDLDAPRPHIEPT